MKISDLFIKNRFPKYWAVSSIFDLLNSQKGPMSLLWDENFFSLNRSDGVLKNLSFRIDFKNVHMTLVKNFFGGKTFFSANVHMTLVKSAPKKSFSLKTILPIENLPKKFVCLIKTFFRCTFYSGHMHIFEISTKRRIFWYPIWPIQRKKVFIF